MFKLLQLSFFLLIMLKFDISNLEGLLQSNQKLVMEFNRIDMVNLNGQSVVGKKSFSKTGKIEFSPTEIRAYMDNTFERFLINKVVKHSDGYQINAQNNKGENFVFAIVKEQGIAFVTMHFVDIEMLGMYHISKNFTLNIPMYNK